MALPSSDRFLPFSILTKLEFLPRPQRVLATRSEQSRNEPYHWQFGYGALYSTVTMRWVGKMRPRNETTRILLFALLSFLLLFGTAIEATHVHTDGAAHPDCALCQTAHNVVRPVTTLCVEQVFAVLSRISVPRKRLYREHIFSFCHWNRPPPFQIAVS